MDTIWTSWNSWSTCTEICNTGTRYRDRQCPGSVPLGTINRPPKTAQYGGERDCYGDPRETVNCNELTCARKLLSLFTTIPYNYLPVFFYYEPLRTCLGQELCF